MNPLVLEIIRQILRWLGVWLMTVGVPSELAALFDHPAAVDFVAGVILYAMADTGWLMAKWRQWRGAA